MKETHTLLRKSAKHRFGIRTWIIAATSTFAGLWLLLEPLGLFGVWQTELRALRILGYLLLFVTSGLLALLGLAIRSGVSDRKVVSHLLKGDPDAFQNQVPVVTVSSPPSAAVGRFLHEIAASLEPVPVRKMLRLASSADGVPALGAAQRAGILILLRDLGLVSIDGNELAQPVSGLAACFIRSMAEGIIEDVDFVGGWKERGTNNPAARMPRMLLRHLEERRISSLGLARARPIRMAQAALAIIKGMRKGEEVFLMQKSDAWGMPYYWFIGGILEAKDKGSFEACLYRELSEELSLARKDILAVTQICEASDLRVSSRIGALTDYQYRVFSVQLDGSSSTVGLMVKTEFAIETFEGMATFTRMNKWLTWAELDTADLQRDAPSLIQAIQQCGPSTLPISIPQEITS